jgi:hypothetical protein
LTLNEAIVQTIAEFDPINLADKSDSKKYRMDFRMSVDINKVMIKGLEKKVTKQFVFEVFGWKIKYSELNVLIFNYNYLLAVLFFI